MRATVTIPDDLFAEADRMASALGISRSRLFQDAVARYLRTLREQALTNQVNDHVATSGPTNDQGFRRYVAKVWAEDMGDDEW